jgi:hypothetical protein
MTKADYITIASTDTETLDRADGPSVVATAAGDADRDLDAEVYATHGIVSRPSSKTRAIRFRIGRLSIVIAAYTYGVDPPANPGATKVYSTDAAGDEQATHLLDNERTHKFNGGSRNAARKDDAIQSTMTDDPTFWTWIAAAGAVLTGLGVAVPIPTALTGKVTDGTKEVLLP